MSARRLAVWGDPISHSRSPELHAAAYRALGLDWEYSRRQVASAELAATLASLDQSWLGLSLTMPLKEEAFRLCTARDQHAELTGAVNTILLGDAYAGFNTDVGGIVDALSEQGIADVETIRVLGSGATASSALVAASDIGAVRAEIRARRPERAAGLVALGERLGLSVSVSDFDAAAQPVDLTLATLPSGTVLSASQSDPILRAGGALFEAAYVPWPSALAASWGTGTVVSGLSMLLHQAVRQIRVFLHGDPHQVLKDEGHILDVMRACLHSQD